MCLLPCQGLRSSSTWQSLMNLDYVEYAEAVLNGEVPTSKYVELACQKFADELESGCDEYYFDAAQADKYLTFFAKFLRHSKGKFAGKPFDLLPWQSFIVANIFGWRHNETGHRRYRTAYIQVGRKNGKTTLLAGLSLAMLDFDNEEGSEVYYCATKRDQARICFDEAARMVKSSPALSKRIGVHRANLHNTKTNSKAEPLSSDRNSLDGLNAHLAVVDEYHAHATSHVYNVLKSSMGSRTQPLMMTITTAGFNVDGPCFQLAKTCKEVLDGKKTDDSLFSMIYELDEDDDWKDPEVWFKANPSLGASISMEYLQQQATQARNYGGAEEVNFKTKHCNLFVRSSESWVSDEVWQQNDHGKIEIDGERACYGGLDLASVSDFCSLVLVFPHEDGGYDTRRFYWLPEEAIEKRLYKDESTIYMQLKDADEVTVTPGNVTDYDYIRRAISGYYIEDGQVKFDEDCIMRKYDLRSIAFDRYNSSQLIINLTQDGVDMSPMGQGYVSMSAPMKEVYRLLLEGKLNHEGDPTLRWMAGNLEVSYDPAMNCKPDKARSQDKIDGITALICAVGEAMTHETEDAFPEDYTIRFL
jgi:phage terminase large subunit-like protein